MRILGWGKDTFYPKNINVLADGSISEDSTQIFRPYFSLNELLSEIYRDAKNSYLHSVPSEATAEEANAVLEKMLPKIERAESLIEEARGYMIDIVDELALDTASALRLDRDKTAKNGEEYITIKSLDEWCTTKYKRAEDQTSITISASDLDEGTIGEIGKPVSEMSKPERSLYTVLGLVTHAFAKELGGKYIGVDGRVNVKQTTDAIVAMGRTYMDTDVDFPNQSFASVKSRVTLALQAVNHERNNR